MPISSLQWRNRLSSILSNAGQACVCGSRLIVEATVADELAAALVARLAAIRPGPTWDEATDYSPVISERQIARMDGIIRAAIDDGAECLTGGRRLDREGYFYAPTLISGVTATSLGGSRGNLRTGADHSDLR